MSSKSIGKFIVTYSYKTDSEDFAYGDVPTKVWNIATVVTENNQPVIFQTPIEADTWIKENSHTLPDNSFVFVNQAVSCYWISPKHASKY